MARATRALVAAPSRRGGAQQWGWLEPCANRHGAPALRAGVSARVAPPTRIMECSCWPRPRTPLWLRLQGADIEAPGALVAAGKSPAKRERAGGFSTASGGRAALSRGHTWLPSVCPRPVARFSAPLWLPVRVPQSGNEPVDSPRPRAAGPPLAAATLGCRACALGLWPASARPCGCR
jgi:hypothetical protein